VCRDVERSAYVPLGYVRNVRHERRRSPRGGLVAVKFLALITAGALPRTLGTAQLAAGAPIRSPR
jgi:hypothetical protein